MTTTINAVMPVSPAPPRVLVGLPRSSRAHAA
ncbi:flavin reductase family protein [Streptomyces sp. MRC013]|nr:flavin reductase family protein [Streptomyces sp. MRC013]URM89288.1 flavin reductase family protein [Streptomyces sp. MRC013]